MNKPKEIDKVTAISPYVYVGIRVKDLPPDIRVRLKRLKNRYSIDMIQDAIYQVTNIEPKVLGQKHRHKHISEARKMYCYFVKQKMNLSLKQIGDTIGRDHTTIIHNIQVFKDLYRYDEAFRKMADDVSNFIEFNSLDNL